MRVYDDNSNNRLNILQSTASASTMISSVAAHVKDYIMSKFPKNFFKDYYIDTSETVTQQNKRNNYNVNANKIPYPSISVSPEISLDDPIGGMQKSIHMSSPNLYLRQDIKQTYRKILIDTKDRFSMHYTSDYITTNFNVKIATNSYIQNCDMALYLKSKFQSDFFQYLNRKEIQTEIPKSFIKTIADIFKLDLDDPDDMENLRLYLIGTSKTEDAIQKKTNLSTGKECFFINEIQNLLILMSDLDCPPSVIRDGHAEGEYLITFRLQVSCYLPNAFILSIDKNIFKTLEKETIKVLSSDDNQQDSGFFTINIKNSTFGKKHTKEYISASGTKQIGQMISSEIYTYKYGDSLEEIPLLLKLNTNIKKVHGYCVEKGIDVTDLFHVELYSKNGKISPDKFDIDPDTMILKILDDLDSDFAVGIYMNRLTYDSILEAIKTDEYYFSGNYLTTIISKLSDGSDGSGIIVNSFANEKERKSKDISKMLRINTAYGVGYIKLIDEDVNGMTKSAYKVCLGMDELGNPIIKELATKKGVN